MKKILILFVLGLVNCFFGALNIPQWPRLFNLIGGLFAFTVAAACFYVMIEEIQKETK